MKKLTLLTLILLAALALNAQVAINTDGTTADPSAMLEVKSTTEGLIIPRTDTTTVNTAHPGAIATGLLIYQTGDNTFYYYNGSRWEKLTPGNDLVFERNGTTIRQTGNYSDDFILGSNSLPQNGQDVIDTLLFFDRNKAAFRVGQLYNSPNWSPDNVGFASFASGYNTKASGYSSAAWGESSQASGESATAWGESSQASGDYATAWGNHTRAPSGYETTLGQFNSTYSPNNSTGWNNNDRLFVIGNGPSAYDRNNALTLMKNGKLGLNTDNPGSELHIVDDKDADDDVVLRMQSNNSNNDAIIEFYEGTAEAMSLHYDGGDNALFITDLKPNPDKKRLKIERSTGSIIPQADKVADLGTASLAWNDIYCDDLHEVGTSAFVGRSPSKEILSYPPKPKSPGDFDYKTKTGDVELNPKSMPPGLADENSLIIDEMTTYNYKANYEQQVTIEKQKEEIAKLKKENEQLKKVLKELDKRVSKLEKR